MKKQVRCNICFSSWHYTTFCPQKQHKPIKTSRKPISPESPKTRIKRRGMASRWFNLNPPDSDGHWICYLQISELCPRYLTRGTVTLEHVYPKVKNPEFKFNVNNIKPSCAFCNKLKGSNTPEQLAKYFVKIAVMISKPEFKEWKSKLFSANIEV